ncbi:nuclease domain-containing protein [Rhizobium ruizarguesonis]
MDWTGEGWSCSEGDLIAIETQTTSLPVVTLGARALQPVRLIATEEGFFARFEFLIDTWAGRSTLRLQDCQSVSFIILQIRPSDRKLGQNEFDEMLMELARHSPNMLWGLSPGEGAGDISSLSPAIVHPAVVQSQMPLLTRLLKNFIADPPTMTFRARQVTHLNFTKRVDIKTIRWLARKPSLLAELHGNSAGPNANVRLLVDQPNTLESFKHPITGYFAHLLNRLLRRFKDSADLLRNGSGRAFRNQTIEEHAWALAASLDKSADEVRSVLGLHPFREIQPEPPSDTTLQLLSDHPLYSAIHRVAQLLLAPGLAFGPNGSIQSALKHTYDLFELFVLYRLLIELPGNLGPKWTLLDAKPANRLRREERPEDRAIWLFKGPDDLSLELHYQQWFTRAKAPLDHRRFTSLSGLNIPDYTLVLKRGTTIISWVILDAKYRSGRQAVDQGLGDVHRYRDALRVRGVRADGAFVVVPRLQEEKAVYSMNEYFNLHAFGAIQLFSPGWLNPVATIFKSASNSE